MNPRVVFIAILAMTMLNGFTSPAVVWVFWLKGLWLPEWLMTPSAAYYGSTLIVAVGTLLFAGVPAALFERFTGRSETDSAVMLVWLAGAGLLTLPGVMG